MNFIVGFLIIISGSKEEEAFWSFIYLGKNVNFLILGFFEDGFPLAYFYLYIFDSILERENKKLYLYIKSL